LLYVFGSGERFTDILGFDIPDRNILPGKYKIGSSTIDPGRFVGDEYIPEYGFKQCLQITPVTVHSGNTGFVALIDSFDVLRDGHVAVFDRIRGSGMY
jgi:hypothetical protein